MSASPVVSVLRNYAIFLLRHSDLDQAELYLNRAMDACNDQGGTLNGELNSEWELVAELQDLLKECNDVRAGKLRKGSIQATGGVAVGNGMKARKESRKKSGAEEHGPRRDSEAFGISGKLKSIRNRTRKSSRMEKSDEHLRDFRTNSLRSSDLMVRTDDEEDREEELSAVRERNRQLLQKLTFTRASKGGE